MRIAVVSDTHLPRAGRVLPARLLAECRTADLILHAGDFVALSVLVELELCGTVLGVLGNGDDEGLARRLPVERVVEAGGARIGMIHDSGRRDGRADRLRARFPDCHAVVFGHSHQPLVERVDGLLLVNPGSPTDRRRAPEPTIAVLTVSEGAVEGSLVVV